MKKNQLHILLIEDDIDDQLFFKTALNELNISANLTTIKDGEELMNYLYRSSDTLPDIIFLDLNMPRKNGFEVLVEISGIEILKNIPLAVLSTSFPQDKNYEKGMMELLFSLGADVFIRKPNHPDELKQVILNALNMVKENT